MIWSLLVTKQLIACLKIFLQGALRLTMCIAFYIQCFSSTSSDTSGIMFNSMFSVHT